jgi:hypothetical protein
VALSSRVKEELIIQLVMLGLLVLITGVYVWVLLPRWKKEVLLKQAMDRILDARVVGLSCLSGAEEMLIQQFRQEVSAWDHEQIQKFRGKKLRERLQELQKREQRDEKAGDSTEESS